MNQIHEFLITKTVQTKVFLEAESIDEASRILNDMFEEEIVDVDGDFHESVTSIDVKHVTDQATPAKTSDIWTQEETKYRKRKTRVSPLQNLKSFLYNALNPLS